MHKSPFKLLLVLVLVSGAFVFLNKSFGVGFGLNAAANIFSSLSAFKKTTSSINTVSNLTKHKIDLERKNYELLSQLAELDNTRSENEFLRSVLKIPEKNKHKFALGNIYTWSLGPGGYSVLLNKGSNDDIAVGDLVISKDRVLIGTVSEVKNNFSKILVVTDLEFKATAKVLGLDTIGIVNGAMQGSLEFNLIVQDDQIKEGDIIVTSGDDIFPDSLIIGRVSKVEFTETQVFKKVLIEPELTKISLGRVIILKK